MARPDGGNPLRTGIFGIVLVACLVLVSFGYASLPFLPQGKPYDGVLHRRRRNLAGQRRQRVGYQRRQGDRRRAGGRRRQGDIHRRPRRPGRRPVAGRDQDRHRARREVAGGHARRVPASRRRSRWAAPPLPYTLNTALQDLGQNASDLDKPQFEQALQVLTDTLRDATPQLRGALDGVAVLSRSINERDEALEQLLAHAKTVSDTLGAARRAGQPADRRRQPAVRRARSSAGRR